MAELHQPHATHPAHADGNPEVHHEESDVNIRGANYPYVDGHVKFKITSQVMPEWVNY